MALRFDVDQGVRWKTKVDEEIASVNITLQEITKITTTPIEEGDTILQWLVSVGEAEQEAWDRLVKGFNEVSQITGDIIEKTRQGIEDVGEKIEEWINRFRHK